MDNKNYNTSQVKEALKKAKKRDVEKRLRAGRNIFLILLFLQSFGVYLLFKTYPSADSSLFTPDIFFIGFFFFLYLFAFKFPYRSFVLGIASYLLLNGFLAIISVNYILRGYSFKIFVFIILTSGFFYMINVRKKLKLENVN